MNEEQLKALIKEMFAELMGSLKFKIENRCAGHMSDEEDWLVVSLDDKVVSEQFIRTTWSDC